MKAVTTHPDWLGSVNRAWSQSLSIWEKTWEGSFEEGWWNEQTGEKLRNSLDLTDGQFSVLESKVMRIATPTVLLSRAEFDTNA